MSLDDYMRQRGFHPDFDVIDGKAISLERMRDVMTCTDPNYKPEPAPWPVYSPPVVRDEHDWTRDWFIVRAELLYGLR